MFQYTHIKSSQYVYHLHLRQFSMRCKWWFEMIGDAFGCYILQIVHLFISKFFALFLSI